MKLILLRVLYDCICAELFKLVTTFPDNTETSPLRIYYQWSWNMVICPKVYFSALIGAYSINIFSMLAIIDSLLILLLFSRSSAHFPISQIYNCTVLTAPWLVTPNLRQQHSQRLVNLFLLTKDLTLFTNIRTPKKLVSMFHFLGLTAIEHYLSSLPVSWGAPEPLRIHWESHFSIHRINFLLLPRNPRSYPELAVWY